jgi:nucleolar protein 4
MQQKEEKNNEENDDEGSAAGEQMDVDDQVEEDAEVDLGEDLDGDDDDEEDNDDDAASSDYSEDEDDEDDNKNSRKNKRNEKQKADKVKEVKNPKLELKAKSGTKDVQEKRTVFVRNLSYDSTEEIVREAFSKFGTVKYVKLCYDKELERPRGTGFIQFEEAQSAIDACAESDILEIDFRKLQIDLALPRTQIKEIVDEKKSSEKEKKDTRNLELAKEGTIYSNSREAEGVPKADMIKRQNLEQLKNQKLKLLNYFVSPTRLTVHNLPKTITDDELKTIMLRAIDGKRSDILKCRIMRDLTRVSADGVARSKGFAFVEFKDFIKAKKALHATNNNPNLFKTNTRLIVQFSIENMKAIKKKEQTAVKSRIKQQQINPSSDDNKKRGNNKKQKGNTNVYNFDELEAMKRTRQKNLIKLDSIEKIISKKKEEEEKKATKKAHREGLKLKKIEENEVRLSELSQKLESIKKEKRIKRKERQKLKRAYEKMTKGKTRKNEFDHVDELVEKYQSKSKN